MATHPHNPIGISISDYFTTTINFTIVIAFANGATGFSVGIEELGSLDTIAPAVSKGNTTLLEWINEDMAKLGAEKFFHSAYEKTLLDVYGADYEDTLVVEPGQAAN